MANCVHGRRGSSGLRLRSAWNAWATDGPAGALSRPMRKREKVSGGVYRPAG
jgi:hypothetical protein